MNLANSNNIQVVNRDNQNAVNQENLNKASSNQEILKSDSNQPVVFMKPNSSLLFQNTIFYGQIYFYLYFVATLFCFIVKSFRLHYPPHTISVEIICLLFFFVFNLGRYHIGNIGNKTESSAFLVFFLIFSVFPSFSFIYFLALQVYVLKFELILNSLGIFFTILEFIFCFLGIVVISLHEKAI